MAWKDILVFADGSENGVARAQMAASFARSEGARLSICVFALLPSPNYGEGSADFGDLLETACTLAREDAGRAADAIRKSIPEIAERLIVTAPEAHLADIPTHAAALARSVDFVVLGQPIEEDLSTLDEAVFEGALFGSGRPCLMLPRWPSQRAWGRRVLIAWKGAPQASRAIHDALPILCAADAVRIFSHGEKRQLRAESMREMTRVRDHLSQYGVRVEKPAFEVSKESAGDAILAAAEEFEADLIIMGGYGHSRIRELVFGGATRTIAQSSKIPVLLSH